MEIPIIPHGEIIQISHIRINKSLNKALIMVEETCLIIVNLFPSSTQQQTENSEQNTSNLANLVSDLSKATVSFMNETRSSIRNLEAQVGQLSKRITETPPSTLPSNTEENPKRECKAIN